MTAATTISQQGADATQRTARPALGHHAQGAGKTAASALGFAQALADMLNGAPAEGAELTPNPAAGDAAAVPQLADGIAPDLPTDIQATTAQLELANTDAPQPDAATIPAIAPPDAAAEPLQIAANITSPAMIDGAETKPASLQTAKDAKTEKPIDQSETSEKDEPQDDTAAAAAAAAALAAPVQAQTPPPPPRTAPELQVQAASVQAGPIARTQAPATQSSAQQATADGDAPKADETADKAEAPSPNHERAALHRPAAPTFVDATAQHRPDHSAADQFKPQTAPDTAPAPATADAPAPAQFDTAPIPAALDAKAEPLVVNRQDWETTLADQIAANLSEDGDKMELQLNPDNLGALTIKLEMTDAGAQVTILTDTAEAANLFQQSEHRLSEALQKTGLSLAGQDTGQRQQSNTDQSGQGSRSQTRAGTDLAFGRPVDRMAPGQHPGLRQASLLNIVA